MIYGLFRLNMGESGREIICGKLFVVECGKKW
ncbi:hypothetical protein N824_17250 [Pedobacter sp. V48]|nr:hypothetical protein N824_17250 [Pedobacter sp. V48]